MAIPIRNLYYLFSYAWAQFPAGATVEVGVDESPDVPNLLARLLVSGANRILRRGLDRGYRGFTEEIRAPRGKILLDETLRGQSQRRGAVVCAFDELTPDVDHNQIIKATARLLTSSGVIAASNRTALSLLVSKLGGVMDVRLTSGTFRRVQLSRNTAQYLPLLKLCELAHRAALPDEQGGGSRFADILKDEVLMSTVFEIFLKNFYAHEQTNFSVASEIMPWSGVGSPADWAFLPEMKTDVTLRSECEIIVLDAKFYAQPLVRNQYGGRRVHSSHLYQLSTYLRHVRRSGDERIRGGLVYASAGEPFHLKYVLEGAPIDVVAIDLAQPWQAIRSRLLDLVRPHVDQAASSG